MYIYAYGTFVYIFVNFTHMRQGYFTGIGAIKIFISVDAKF